MIDYIVVGSGLAGSVLAERIANVLNKKVLLVEKESHLAGHCYDYKDENNIIIHRYGPHLFHTDNKKVFDYLSNFTDWHIYNHEVLAYVDGKKIPVPFNLNSLYSLFPNTIAKKIEEKFLQKYQYNSKVPILELKQSTDTDLQFLASYIYEKIFLNYTIKQWEMRPEDINESVTARVPIFIGKDNRYFNDKYQMVPKYGYTNLVQNILDNPNIKLMLNTNFKEICSLSEEHFYLFGSKFDGKIIFTGQIDELFDYKFGELPYRSLRLQFETIETDYYQEKTTINYPNNYDFTRITEFKHIHPTNSPKTTILREYPQEYIKNKNTPYYPILTNESQEKYNRYLEYSKKFKNLILVGRLAEYKYYDMDDVVARALELFEEEVK